jgi:hypothetical protein
MEFYTGTDNIDLTRYYKSINGLTYTNLNKTGWNGN